MMDRLDRQILKAVIGELGGDLLSRISDPADQAKIVMARFMLAHAVARQQAKADGSTAGEIAALAETMAQEQAILAENVPSSTQLLPMNGASLTAYLRATLDCPSLAVTDVCALLGGYSKQTYLLTLSGADRFDNALVLRRDLEGSPVEVRAADEYPVIRLMHDRGLPVPEPVAVDSSPPFGGTLLVMRRAPGQAAFDATGQFVAGRGRDAALALARVLAQIHATPVAALGLSSKLATLPLKEHVRRQIKAFEDQWERRHASPSPVLSAAFAWLFANVPDGGDPALVHGDASLRNLLIHDGRESAMLDWELSHVGDPAEDLGYSRSDIERAMPWDEFMAEYAAHGGRPYDPATSDYYGIFGAVRNCVFAQSCLHDLLQADQPALRFGYGGLLLGRPLLQNIADKLSLR